MTIYCSTCSKAVQLTSRDAKTLEKDQQTASDRKERLVIICAHCHWVSMGRSAKA